MLLLFYYKILIIQNMYQIVSIQNQKLSLLFILPDDYCLHRGSSNHLTPPVFW